MQRSAKRMVMKPLYRSQVDRPRGGKGSYQRNVKTDNWRDEVEEYYTSVDSQNDDVQSIQ